MFAKEPRCFQSPFFHVVGNIKLLLPKSLTLNRAIFEQPWIPDIMFLPDGKIHVGALSSRLFPHNKAKKPRPKIPN